MVLFAQTDFQNIAQKHTRVWVKMPRFWLLKQYTARGLHCGLIEGICGENPDLFELKKWCWHPHFTSQLAAILSVLSSGHQGGPVTVMSRPWRKRQCVRVKSHDLYFLRKFFYLIKVQLAHTSLSLPEPITQGWLPFRHLFDFFKLVFRLNIKVYVYTCDCLWVLCNVWTFKLF